MMSPAQSEQLCQALERTLHLLIFIREHPAPFKFVTVLCWCCNACSHNYREPEVFAGQTVVVVGAANSGVWQRCHACLAYACNTLAVTHSTTAMCSYFAISMASEGALR